MRTLLSACREAAVAWWRQLPPLVRSSHAFYAAAAMLGIALLFSFHQVVSGSVDRVANERRAAKAGGVTVVAAQPALR